MIAILLSIGVLSPPVVGQLGSQKFPGIDFDDSTDTQVETLVAESAIADPGILPNNPLYFIKRIGESMRLMLAFDEGYRERLHIEFASMRLAEAKAIAEKSPQFAQTALEEFIKEVDSMKPASLPEQKKVRDFLESGKPFLKTVSEAGNSNLKDAVGRALESIENTIDKAKPQESEIPFMPKPAEEQEQQVPDVAIPVTDIQEGSTQPEPPLVEDAGQTNAEPEQTQDLPIPDIPQIPDIL